MAIYHFSVQILKRSKGHSAIAAAAYRSASLLRDERTGKSHDYQSRRGVVWSGILLPDGAPEELKERQVLWSKAEAMEARGDAQLAREINLALPKELDAVRRKELLLNFVQEAFVNRGMAADVAIHEPVPGKNASPDNHHGHIMLAMRRVTRAGLHRVKTREWNSRELLKEWRALWAVHQNRALERAGVRERVDHRTLVAQRDEALRRGDRAAALVLDRLPQIHVGPRATRAAMKRMPVSRVREVGPPRKRPGMAKAVRRVVTYPRLDAGSRLAWRAVLLQRTKVERSRKMQRLQVKAMRLRERKVRLLRDEMRLQAELRRLVQSRQNYRWLEGRERRAGLDEAVRDMARRLAHRQDRGKLIERVIAELDRTLARLEVRSAVRTRSAGRVLDHARAKHPSDVSSATPGNAGPSRPG
ncbi:hypothetical protein DW352_02750 [Pseudolabrys taiwanensis]|uniref:MobA/MobL protein domain-containing protein n=1 Tax=Pseudolabrys taiwanensis TaxID=331696 RepID=A0A345ZRI4_9HYPH|nr:MobQ family relaxase [Pseudolabrys taiwanensis]AXK79531.1 hypothetical protein DW352_02750 [Pseudolabrys taiwanensis]